MRAILNLCAVLLFPIFLTGQENGTVLELLVEAKSKIYNQPAEAEKIAEYVVKQTDNATLKAEALLVLSKSQYVQGNLEAAANAVMEANAIWEETSHQPSRAQTLQFAIKLMRELGLGNMAHHYFNKLQTLQGSTEYIDALILQNKAYISLGAEDFQKAEKLLQKAREKFKTNKDTVALLENSLLLSQVYQEKSQLEDARLILQKELEGLDHKNGNNFLQLQLISQLASILFAEKNHQASLQKYERAWHLAQYFQNNPYKGKSLEGLSLNYLALEDSKKFFAYKQQASTFAGLAENDRNQAINTVFNFINHSGEQRLQTLRENAFTKIYILGGLLLLVLASGLLANHWYRSRAKEYRAFLKYMQPQPSQPVAERAKAQAEKSSTVPEEIEMGLLQKLEKFEMGTKFTNQEMSIAYLASQLDTNTKYLSEVINRQKGKNFNSYINELRVNYIIEKLKTEPVYFNYKVSYLAEESGFSSHSSFATVFKSVTGISPTKFMELLQKRKESA